VEKREMKKARMTDKEMKREARDTKSLESPDYPIVYEHKMHYTQDSGRPVDV
jgi:hypothetical protein